MIPFRDSVKATRFPWVVLFLSLALAAFYVWELRMGSIRRVELFEEQGLVPYRFLAVWKGALGGGAVSNLGLFHDGIVAVFGAMFLSLGPVQLVTVVGVLYLFGDNVEGRMGHGLFLLFVALARVWTAVSQCVLLPQGVQSLTTTDGIATACLVAYLCLFRKACVQFLVPLLIVFPIIELPAFLVLPVYAILEVPPVRGCLGFLEAHGILWQGHVGAVAAGLLLGPAFAFLGRNAAGKGQRKS